MRIHFEKIGLMLVAAEIIGCQSPEPYADTAQRSVIETFTRAYFKGETKLAYQLLSKEDRDLIAMPLKKATNEKTLGKTDVWEMLNLVNVTNPYDIKSIDLAKSYAKAPADGELTEVVVQRHNGVPQHYKLRWENQSWKIDLGLKH